MTTATATTTAVERTATSPQTTPQTSPQAAPQTSPQAGPARPLSHQEILKVMTGLLAALFTALLSSTIVSTALPTIMSDLHGTQRQYTWVITSSLLALTVSTPIWGKLADLFNKKTLVQFAIVLFVAGSIGAGLSQTVPVMMAFRAVQGLAMGGLTALTQAIIGSIIPPRQRGRYSGYMGAVIAVSTVSGPLLGGVITQHLDWRYCFFVCVPLAVIALIVLQKTLHLPTVKQEVHLDYLGAVLIAISATLPMLWVTFAGKSYDWISWQSGLFLVGFLAFTTATVITELRVRQPMVPIRVLRNSTTALMIVASIGVGTALYGSSTFLTQYFQLAKGDTPTMAGVMTIPLIATQMLASIIGGQIVSRTGRWKPIMVFGSILLVLGLAGMGTIDHATPYWHVAVFMAVMGIGIGTLIQNIVLAVQNTVDVKDIGASSATISFFRSLGGAIGVTVLGAVLADRVQTKIMNGLAQMGVDPTASGGAAASLNIKSLPAPLQALFHRSYGDTFGIMFLIAAAVSVVTLIAVIAVTEVPLRTTVELNPQAAEAGRPAQDSDPAEEPIDQPTARADDIDGNQIAERIDRLGLEVQQSLSRFHGELDEIKAALSKEHRSATVPDHEANGEDRLRSYEYGLLLNSQQTAERVTRLARLEAERILTEADGQRIDIEERIRLLHQMEADLTERVEAGRVEAERVEAGRVEAGRVRAEVRT